MQPNISMFGQQTSTEHLRAALPRESAGATHTTAEAVRDSVRTLVDPLSAVVGFAELLVDGGLDEEERTHYARRICEAARELERRVRQLETLTRSEEEKAGQLALF